MRIYVFSNRDDVDFDEAKKTATDLGGTFIDKMSSKLDALRLIAKYRIVSTPSVVGVHDDDDEVVFRFRGLPSKADVARVLETVDAWSDA